MLCGFNPKMIEGIVTFSEGLYAATMERGQQNNVTDIAAVKAEIKEIDLFIKALQAKYGMTVESSKKMVEMIFGIAVFSGSLFEDTLSQNGHAKADLKGTFDSRVKEISEFLERCENKSQELQKTNAPEQAMVKAVQWIDENTL
jgi:ppGpp synthetase/RelA/SpoT-type nucleotidyltranferase